MTYPYFQFFVKVWVVAKYGFQPVLLLLFLLKRETLIINGFVMPDL